MGRGNGLTSPKVLFIAPEMVPFAKTGGLADVAGALPGALKLRGADVRVIIPCYRSVREEAGAMGIAVSGLMVPLGSARLKAVVLETATAQGVPVFAVEREDLFDRPNLYGTGGNDYYDNLERFVFFCRAALLAARALGFEPDIVHGHDWQAGLIPLLIREEFPGPGSVFTIHNLGYQGLFSKEKLPVTGLAEDRVYHPQGMEYWGHISLLKAGIVYADAVTTVSPTYAREIQTPDQGMGMEGVLRSRAGALTGILNGADYDRWNPETDPHLPATYGAGRMGGKDRSKSALIREMGFGEGLLARPVLAVVSRLDVQKGLDLLVGALDDILSLNVGLVVLGTGDAGIEGELQKAAKRHGDRMAVRFGMDEPLAHRIMGGADLLLVPSRYEPCGLTQMYGMKYGTMPVVRATGGLEDTVTAYDVRTGSGNGFKFQGIHPRALMQAVQEAVGVFEDRPRWERLQVSAMSAEFSWDRAARQYLDVYEAVRTSGLGVRATPDVMGR